MNGFDLQQLLQDFPLAATDLQEQQDGNQRSVEEELSMWSNMQFNFTDPNDPFLIATTSTATNDNTPLPSDLVIHKSPLLKFPGTGSSWSSDPSTAASSVCATTVTPQLPTFSAMQRKRREPIESEEDKRKRNSEASQRFRQRRKEKESTLIQTNQLLVDRNQKLEAKVAELQVEVGLLRGLLLDKTSSIPSTQ
eukprot:Partr_v1_DN28174_c0_g1_i2_m55504